MAIPASQLGFLCDLVYKKSAIVLTPDKEYLVESRLAPIARAEGFGTIDAMVNAMRSQAQPALERNIVEAMTTNETTFFRDFHPFEALRQEIIPRLKKARATARSLTVLSAACSTGQEPYSLAMLLSDPGLELAAWNVRIIGVDLNETVLSRARDGIYNQSEINRGLPPQMLEAHFEPRGVEWQLKRGIRERVEFRAMNLIEPWPSLPRIDLLLIRNVLIYFDVETKKAILRRARGVLAPDGYLVLGGAETTINVDDSFERLQLGPSTVYRLVA